MNDPDIFDIIRQIGNEYPRWIQESIGKELATIARNTSPSTAEAKSLKKAIDDGNKAKNDNTKELKLLVKQMEKLGGLVDINTKSLKDVSKNTSSKTSGNVVGNFNALDRSTIGLTKSFNGLGKSIDVLIQKINNIQSPQTVSSPQRIRQQDNRRFQEFTKSQEKHFAKLGDTMERAARSTGSHLSSMKDASTVISSATAMATALASKLPAAGLGLAALGYGAAKIAEELEKSAAGLGQLNRYGLATGQTLEDFSISLRKHATTIEDVALAVARNRKAFMALGEGSIESFAYMSHEARQVGSVFRTLGMTIPEINEFLSDNLEYQRSIGLIQKLDRQTQESLLERELIRLTKISSTFGKTIADITKETTSYMTRAQVYAAELNVTRTMSSGQRMEYKRDMAQFSDVVAGADLTPEASDQLRDAFMVEAMRKQGKQMTDPKLLKNYALMQTQFPELFSMIQGAVYNGNVTSADIVDALNQSVQNSQTGIMATQSGMNSEFAQMAQPLYASAAALQGLDPNDARKRMEGVENQQSFQDGARDIFQQVENSFQAAHAKMMETLISKMSELSTANVVEGIKSLETIITENFDTLFNSFLTPMMATGKVALNVISGVHSVMKGIGEHFGVSTGSVYGAALLGAIFRKPLTKMIGGALKPLGKIAMASGGFIGRGAQSLLKGTAAARLAGGAVAGTATKAGGRLAAMKGMAKGAGKFGAKFLPGVGQALALGELLHGAYQGYSDEGLQQLGVNGPARAIHGMDQTLYGYWDLFMGDNMRERARQNLENYMNDPSSVKLPQHEKVNWLSKLFGDKNDASENYSGLSQSEVINSTETMSQASDSINNYLAGVESGDVQKETAIAIGEELNPQNKQLMDVIRETNNLIVSTIKETFKFSGQAGTDYLDFSGNVGDSLGLSQFASSGGGGVLGNTVFAGEGGPNSYNRGHAGDSQGRPLRLVDMTLKEIMARQALPKGNPNRLFAVGKPQIIPETMRLAVKALNLDTNQKYTEQMQDYIFREYLVKGKRMAVYNYVTGKSDSLHNAHLAMAREFASVSRPGSYKSSMYGDRGNNAASTTSPEIQGALKAERAAYAQNIQNGMSEAQAWSALSGVGAAVRPTRQLDSNATNGISTENEAAVDPNNANQVDRDNRIEDGQNQLISITNETNRLLRQGNRTMGRMGGILNTAGGTCS